ncbi:peptide/nickel transport system ATP-binding protein [Microbacterium endophyticum]|uniref:ABC transporter ATP-binding protein n=1 Tax=Microbacterium endophyticum TaxID=1526412 RepID=UPI001F497629|nr:dipeptide/oligopeptide/nickel ABC transporter ATP-binding protein [Microbacterium endophyticum]NIK36018.1 peptide/nickel transport system ATP-binding protein [Microbacterium endophyticum]
MSILELESASFSYGTSEVLREVSLSVAHGGAVGLVGESGAGKSTILRLLLGLDSPRAGTVRFDGEPLRLRDRALMRRFRSSVQPVFQDPYSSLDPRQRIDDVIAEPLRSLRLAIAREIPDRVAAAVESVGLEHDVLNRYPHEFSGGQRQRIAIARAIVSRPRVLLADEPVSALDVTTRVQVLDLLATLRREQGLALVMVSHDLGAVASVCDHTIVLKSGQIIEAGPTSKILTAPESGYARELVAAAPRLAR